VRDDIDCPLCALDPAAALWSDRYCYVIRAEIAGLGDVYRVIWRGHIKEMSDLGAAEREHLLTVVLRVEMIVRRLLKPTKMNIASLGNQVPHLHWHVIPRFADDAFFPDSIWSVPRRSPGTRHQIAPDALKEALARDLKPAS